MIPSPRLVSLLAALGVLSALIWWQPDLAGAWYTLAGVAAAAVLADGLLAIGTRAPKIERDIPGSLSLGNRVTVSVTVRNTGARSLKLAVYDHHPAGVTTTDLPLVMRLPPGRSAATDYSVVPHQRGPSRFPGFELRIASPLGFWWRRRFVPCASDVRVYPDYAPISKLLAYEVDSRLSLTGVRLMRRRGEGIEFHQLRDFREGDSLRAVDWKATSRMSRLIAREYQDERDQQIVIVVDAGRRMLAKDDALSHFDHTLNAMLLLAFVALRHGDAAGVMTVGETRTWLPPRKGAGAINGILNHVYEIEPRPVEVDYIAAATDLAVRQRRRSLVVMLTNVRDVDGGELRAATDLLRRRHVVIVASLREASLDAALHADVRHFDDALLNAATNRYLDERREAHRRLKAAGVFVEDCLGPDLPAAITNRYLAIKRAGIL